MPEGWTSAVAWRGDAWSAGGERGLSLPYTGAWVASETYDVPVTRVSCSCRYVGEKDAESQTCTCLALYARTRDGEWDCVARRQMVAEPMSLTVELDANAEYVAVRFVAESGSERYPAIVGLGTVSVICGTMTGVEEEVREVLDNAVTFGACDPTGRYQVAVSPLPSETESSAVSPVVDLATEWFRSVEPISIRGLRRGLYAEDFSSVSNVSASTEVRKLRLDHWQFGRETVALEKVLYNAGGNSTAGGVYVCRAAGGDAEMRLGTLATSSKGYAVGVSFRNDTAEEMNLSRLSFSSEVRNPRTNPAGYVLEGRLSDDADGIVAGDGWKEIVIPDGAKTGSVVSLENVISEKIPVGKVLTLRWRHDKVALGPLLTLDDVDVRFSGDASGFCVIVR